jgi:hypothetical protein
MTLLALGNPAAFGFFTPGIARTNTASTTASVVSTAGDAARASPIRRKATPAAPSTAFLAAVDPAEGVEPGGASARSRTSAARRARPGC